MANQETSSSPSSMHIDLNAMRYNLDKFRDHISTKVKVMMMIKASAYGVGVQPIAKWAEKSHLIDYLGVVYTMEGIELRQSAITLPIMVVNIDQTDFNTCQVFNLEPVIYSISLLKKLVQWMEKNDHGTFPNVHVKINSGMNRLGLEVDEIAEFLSILSSCTYQPTIKSIYSHIAASDDPEEDNYTIEQARIFLSSAQTLEIGLGYSVMKHLCNSMGILRHPHLHFDMVRVGGGLYGVAECFSPFLSSLLPAISMTSTIAQVRRVKKDSTIGYNRRGRVNRDSLIGIIRMGYADGLRRQLGNGKGQVWVQHCRVPFIGSICMDFAMIDLTDVPIDNEIELENQPVEIFGDHISVEEVAQSCNTIVFEFISTIGQRVKHSYIDDEKTTNVPQ